MIISVTGCSTCRRGFSSKKEKVLSGMYRYSTVPAFEYPTNFANRTAASCISFHTSAEGVSGGPSSMIF